MAQDFFITFLKGKGPTKKEVKLIVCNFFGDAAKIKYDVSTWLVSLAGKPTWVFEGIEEDMMPRMRNTERWIEVNGYGTRVSITTRRADEYTNALAEGLANVFTRYWEGELDDGS